MQFTKLFATFALVSGFGHLAAAGTPAELVCEVTTSAQEMVVTPNYDPETRKHSVTINGVFAQIEEYGQGVAGMLLSAAGKPLAIAGGTATRQAPVTLIGYENESTFTRIVCGAKAD